MFVPIKTKDGDIIACNLGSYRHLVRIHIQA